MDPRNFIEDDKYYLLCIPGKSLKTCCILNLMNEAQIDQALISVTIHKHAKQQQKPKWPIELGALESRQI